ncbi:DHHA1 domain-containing protein [Shewanella sp. 6_MG-2023]|uniref:DHHA1 domain-containing protein n=1 Tax=Shewanella sp. 6_MG-2023 TaxID=3062660 RepID=UPI0026E1ECE2|nr:DHHA1 domain-containing protein [Shewanella sp. 6_MG-2023]MDO6617660.1 DHHA1 domain-containing protein [Shewanella sp. 6_MG-2023]
MNYDIFNGDADGIIALLQLRLANPIESTLITGVKRDIQLLSRVAAQPGDELTVLDISMEKNIDALKPLLDSGVKVFYADHHRSGAIPESDNLSAHIDLDPNTCTSLIVDKLLNGQYHYWAIAAAYGDNLIAAADELSSLAGLTVEQAAQLNELGTLINYNGYGSCISDLHFEPAELFLALKAYPNPFNAIADKASPFYKLQVAYGTDMANAQAVNAMHESKNLAVFELPNEAWAKRISGVYGNYLANEKPSVAHAVLTDNEDNTYTVSLRAPLLNKQGAGDICSQFATGGGRAAAAGINSLPKEQLDDFITAVSEYYNL